MNAIITVVFLAMHKVASAQFKVKITFCSVMQQQGGLLTALGANLLAKEMKRN